ncbi:hypothetical protein WICPIJ_010094 [Wickerhamomyces pijperi]|uniref:DUF159-domain-containing protein n=1 Tax=Wickerhamomyces pijperi TaxID=599730 RepID=A0A9P8PH87_WICPI|nr:hypothetical protein WICPIJ_010094 [Wickerhamomyces pijperi]
MCGRFALPLVSIPDKSQSRMDELTNPVKNNEQLLQQFNAIDIPLGQDQGSFGSTEDDPHNTPSYNRIYNPSYNFAPTQLAPIYTNHRFITYNTWGLTTSHDSSMKFSTFNARKEKVQSHDSRLWNSVLQHRCVVPISGYFEWKTNQQNPKRKTPYYISRGDPNDLMFLLGFYNKHESKTKSGKESMGSFTVLTRPSEGSIAWLHDRIPMMVKPLSKEWNDWLNPDLKFSNELLDFTNYEEGLSCYQVSDLVGSTKNNGEFLIKEVKQVRGLNDWIKKSTVKIETGPHLPSDIKQETKREISVGKTIPKDASTRNSVKSSFKVKKEPIHTRRQARSITDMLTSKQVKHHE